MANGVMESLVKPCIGGLEKGVDISNYHGYFFYEIQTRNDFLYVWLLHSFLEIEIVILSQNS